MRHIHQTEWRHADGRRVWQYGAGRPDAELPAAGSDEPVEPLPGLHLRLDRLTDEWVAVTPGRAGRPGGRTDGEEPACPLCPGGIELPFPYEVAVFENRFPTFVEHPPQVHGDAFRLSGGRCEVVVYTDRHDASITTLEPSEIGSLLAVWRDRSQKLWQAAGTEYVLTFENRGADVGATLVHPHGQIYAFPLLPPLVNQRRRALAAHRQKHHRCLHCDVVAEDAESARIIVSGEAFSVTVPFAPRWPYEVHIRARRHGLRRLTDLGADEQRELGAVLQETARRLDGLFGAPMPMMMVILEAPQDVEDWHLAVEFLPVMRDAHRMKVRAAVETATGLFILDREPEQSAVELRAAPFDLVGDVPFVVARGTGP